MMNKSGILIVIDGTDGSGKTTQVKLLIERLIKTGFNVKTADFPQYGHKSAGMIEEYLGGRYGEIDSVSPYIASLFFTMDRYDASFKIKKWLKEGKIVISNRYTTSNMAHQGGKITNPLERKAYYDWIMNMEEKTFKLPKPSFVFFLHVNAELAQEMTKRRSRVDWKGKIKDIHEENSKHLKLAEKAYVEISQTYQNIHLFPCMAGNKILPKETINDMLWEKIIRIIGNNKKNPSLEEIFLEKAAKGKVRKIIGHVGAVIKFKKVHNRAIAPTFSKYDTSLEIYSSGHHSILPGKTVNFKTGIAINIPPGHLGLIIDFNRSKIKEVSALPQIISPGENQELVIRLLNTGDNMVHIPRGLIIAKLILNKSETHALRT